MLLPASVVTRSVAMPHRARVVSSSARSVAVMARDAVMTAVASPVVTVRVDVASVLPVTVLQDARVAIVLQDVVKVATSNHCAVVREIRRING